MTRRTASSTAAVQAAAEARLYAHARAALAFALVAREHPVASPHARALAYATRREGTRVRASPNVDTATQLIVDEALQLVEHIRGEYPLEWRALVDESVGTVARALWEAEVLS